MFGPSKYELFLEEQVQRLQKQNETLLDIIFVRFGLKIPTAAPIMIDHSRVDKMGTEHAKQHDAVGRAWRPQRFAAERDTLPAVESDSASQLQERVEGKNVSTR